MRLIVGLTFYPVNPAIFPQTDAVIRKFQIADGINNIKVPLGKGDNSG